MDNVIIEKIKKEIENFPDKVKLEQVGRVVRAGDGVAEVEGLTDAVMSEMVVFDESEGMELKDAIESAELVYGQVLNLEEDVVKVVILGNAGRVKEGTLVKSLGKVLSVPVSEEIIGRVVNPLGEVLDGKGKFSTANYMPIEREAYGVIDRQSVNAPLHTGIKAIDSMTPIGRGQRELIIGDRSTGKTTLAIDTILNQKNEPKEARPVCIYVAIGQKESKTARIVAELERRGAMEYTVVVSAPASVSAALQFLAPYAGAAIGEYFMDQGKDALVIYDDLSKQAVAYRQMSLLLRRPPGREAYPGDIFYLHSRLLERAAKLSDAKGGGSLTALPIIETQESDVSAYIPTNVISITDGQIYLDAELFNRGMKPAINVGLSVSRVGSAAQTKAMKKVAGKIRLELAQFRELEAFVQFSQDLDENTKRRIESGKRLSEALKQNKNMPLGFERQVPIIYAAVNGLLNQAPVEKVGEVEEKFLAYIDMEKPEIFEKLKRDRDITEEIEKLLKEALADFINTHNELFAK